MCISVYVNICISGNNAYMDTLIQKKKVLLIQLSYNVYIHMYIHMYIIIVVYDHILYSHILGFLRHVDINVGISKKRFW